MRVKVKSEVVTVKKKKTSRWTWTLNVTFVDQFGSKPRMIHKRHVESSGSPWCFLLLQRYKFTLHFNPHLPRSTNISITWSQSTFFVPFYIYEPSPQENETMNIQNDLCEAVYHSYEWCINHCSSFPLHSPQWSPTQNQLSLPFPSLNTSEVQSSTKE